MSIIRFVLIVSALIGASLAAASDIVLIHELRTGLVAEESLVDVRNVRVIAVAPTGVAVDDLEPGPFHTIWVRTATDPGVVPGDFVQIYNAVYQEQGGMSVLDLTLEPGSLVYVVHSALALPQPVVYTPQDFLAGHEGYESAIVSIDSSFYITIIDPAGGWRSRAHPSYLDVPFSGLWIDNSQIEAMDCYADPVGLLVFEAGEYKLAPFSDGLHKGDCASPNARISISALKGYYR